MFWDSSEMQRGGRGGQCRRMTVGRSQCIRICLRAVGSRTWRINRRCGVCIGHRASIPTLMRFTPHDPCLVFVAVLGATAAVTPSFRLADLGRVAFRLALSEEKRFPYFFDKAGLEVWRCVSCSLNNRTALAVCRVCESARPEPPELYLASPSPESHK